MVESHSKAYCDDKHRKLTYGQREIRHLDQFNGNQAGHCQRSNPHGGGKDSHGHLKNNDEEVDDHFTTVSDSSKNCSEYQTEEDDTQGICSRTSFEYSMGGQVLFLFVACEGLLKGGLEDVVRNYVSEKYILF